MDDLSTESSDEKRAYAAPEVELQGRVEELTQWVGGKWGEFFCGPITGWNPWSSGPGS